FGLETVDRVCDPFRAGGLQIEVWATPGHTADSLSFVVDGVCCTGDTLFAGSVGGSASSFADLRHSIMDVLLALPVETRVLPGHSEETSVGEEWEKNPFVRIWRGLDPEGEERCRIAGREARLVLWARDYDEGFKAWLRFDDGSDQIVGGSRVQRER
ncbi:MAG TPA: MBL fold metallo-hydrolase, partial [Gaiellaceae bacterium]